MTTEEVGKEILRAAIKLVPTVADWISSALSAGHGTPEQRRHVADILPAVSESEKAARDLEKPNA